jgi:uncharacterized RDD family membrane protein YckC
MDREENRYAGLVTRTIAFAADAAIINVVALAVGGIVALVLSIFPVSSRAHDAIVAAGAVLFVVWTIGYFIAFWTATGETPGNRTMHIRVVRADGSPLRPRHALARLAGLVLGLPLFLGYVPILLNDRRRGLQDVMAGTVVLTSVATPEEAPARPLVRHAAG